MRKITMMLVLTLAFVTQGYAQFPAPYCGPITFSNNEEPITLVNFAGINNTSPAPVGGIAHEDYTAITGSVSTGITYPITLKGNTDGDYITYLRVFIDWNQDSDFTDANESYDIGTIANSTGTDAVQLSGSILVPATATLGTTRMRVVKKFNAYSDSCNTIGTGWGEAEDYTLAVTAATCTQPTVAFAVVSNCPAATFNVTATVTNFGSATSIEFGDNQASAPQVVTATGTTTFGPYANGTDVVLTGTLSNTACNVTSTSLTQLGCVPGCAGTPSPANAATGVPYGPITLSWTAPATGDPVVSYDLYAGDTATTLTYVGSYAGLDTGTDLTINAYGVTVFWQIIAVNEGGEAVGCSVWSFTTENSPGYCLDGYQYPEDTYIPTTCDGVEVNEINSDAYTGEYAVVTVTNGQPYVFTSSVATDFITISNDLGDTNIVSGLTPLAWTANLDGDVRFYLHSNSNCLVEEVERTRGIICGTPSADSPDYAGLQFPATMNLPYGGTGVVYGRVYEPGVTPGAGAGAGITAWVGVNAANTNPGTWTESSWIPATFNVDSGNDDEYIATIGADLTPGTYYYAVRFRLNAGAYVYGGTDGTNGNFWNGTTHNNGVLTLAPPPAPANDECAGAIAVVPGGDFAAGAITTTNFGATDDALESTCQDDEGEDVWYTVAVPASGNVTIETGDVDGSLFNDSVVSVYSGACGSLVLVECDDDASDNGLFSLIELTGRTPGEVLHISVSRFNSVFATGDWGEFQLSAYDASLGNPGFNTDNFRAYPNPVKNVLNLSSLQNISNVAVYNLLGQQVIAKAMNASQGQIDMSALSAGTYMVKVTADNQVKTIKVIKE